jgi:hypothetical protein
MKIASWIQFGLLFLAIVILHIRLAKYRIKQWAAQKGFNITECKICLKRIGPFSYIGTSGSQSVFKIEAVNSNGEVKKGYVRAGGFFLGLLRKRVEVKWDKNSLSK